MSRANTRRQAREWALQLLFQLDLNPCRDIDAVFESFWNQQWISHADDVRDTTGATPLQPDSPAATADAIAPSNIRAFVSHLVKGVSAHRAAIDEQLAAYARNWPVYRMGVVDRNVLRMALFEIFHSDQTPPVVVINEAIDLAKYFSNSESGRFVNGILDRAVKESARKSP